MIKLCTLALLVLGCDTKDLQQDYGPPQPHPQHTSETSAQDCDLMGGQWIPNAQVAIGGTCRLQPPPPPPVLRLPWVDGGVGDAGDAGADH